MLPQRVLKEYTRIIQFIYPSKFINIIYRKYKIIYTRRINYFACLLYPYSAKSSRARSRRQNDGPRPRNSVPALKQILIEQRREIGDAVLGIVLSRRSGRLTRRDERRDERKLRTPAFRGMDQHASSRVIYRALFVSPPSLFLPLSPPGSRSTSLFHVLSLGYTASNPYVRHGPPQPPPPPPPPSRVSYYNKKFPRERGSHI